MLAIKTERYNLLSPLKRSRFDRYRRYCQEMEFMNSLQPLLGSSKYKYDNHCHCA